jgi:hypothetical protein
MKLTQLDLFEISQEIRRDYAPKMSDSTPKLTLMPVAPKHLYAYWSLGNNKTIPLQANSNLPLTLRIYSSSDKDNYLNKGYEDIPLNRAKSQQDIFLATPSTVTSYQASLGVCFSNNVLDVIADSNCAQLPQEQTPLFWAKPNSRTFLTSTNKGNKAAIHNNGSGQGIK